MASAHAKFTGQPGLSYAASGPGAIHLLTGLYDAKADHMPVVAIVGQQARSALRSHYQQKVDLQTLFGDVSEYVMTATVPGQVRTLIDRAVRIAQAKRAVTCVIILNNLQELAYADLPIVHGATHTGVGFPGVSKVPNQEALQRAADILNEGKKVAMLVGAGCQAATDEVIAAAERLGAGVAKPLLGKAAVPDDLPYVMGSLGCSEPSRPGSDAEVRHALDGRVCLPPQRVPPQARYRAWRPDRHRRRQTQPRYPMEYSRIGDSAATLRALLPLLTQGAGGDRPVILEMYTDPNVPPLPPHITLKGARNFAVTTVGEPELGSVRKNSARQMSAGMLPHKS